jgi:hypothetical protein
MLTDVEFGAENYLLSTQIAINTFKIYALHDELNICSLSSISHSAYSVSFLCCTNSSQNSVLHRISSPVISGIINCKILFFLFFLSVSEYGYCKGSYTGIMLKEFNKMVSLNFHYGFACK